jgi:Aldo/keto reductase family
MVFTKVGPQPLGHGYEPGAIRAAAQDSLRRLGRDVIDLYQAPPAGARDGRRGRMGGDGRARRPRSRALDRRLQLRPRTAGVVPANQARGLARAEPVSALPPGAGPDRVVRGAGHRRDCIRTAHLRPADGIDRCRHAFRARRLAHRQHRRPTRQAPLRRPPGHLATVEALGPIAERLGLSRAQLALAWAVVQQGVTGVICGTTSSERARENAASGSWELPLEDLAEIDALTRR